MGSEELRHLLERVRAGDVPVDRAVHQLAVAPFLEAGTNKFDVHRSFRRGLPEVVYCEGKSAEQVRAIYAGVAERGLPVLGTRAAEEHHEAVREVLPRVTYDTVGRLLRWVPEPSSATTNANPAARLGRGGKVAVVSAGSSDEPVLREAAGTLEAFGHDVAVVTDAGVAGLHRILPHIEALNEALVVIVVAGMDGALPSVVAGLISSPVIAVPTSVGYGASFGGISALLAMLNSCAGGVTVVNIDNGFGAAYAASLIVRRVARHAENHAA